MTARGEIELEVGRIAAVYGIRGWVKILSHTKPMENILSYQPWRVCRNDRCTSYQVAEGRRHGKGLIARLQGIADRDAAAALVGATIFVNREQFPDVEADEYYWADLEGLQVITLSGQHLGRVDRLLATGANDVLVVTDASGHERLIPFIREQVVRRVDLAAGTIQVDWDPAF